MHCPADFHAAARTATPSADDTHPYGGLAAVRQQRLALFTELQGGHDQFDIAAQSALCKRVCDAHPVPAAYQSFTHFPDDMLADD